MSHSVELTICIGEEEIDPEHGECMVYLYVSECRQFEAHLLIV